MNEIVARVSPSRGEVRPTDDPLLIMARQISAAPPAMLPKMYHGNVGACYLLADWAQRNDVSALEAIGEVAFVFGKPVVSAVLQKKMAARVGFRTQKVEGDGESCTVKVLDQSGAEVGRVTYTMATAMSYGIHWDNKNDRIKNSWGSDPAHMLYKRATTRALEYYGPSELAPLLVDVDDRIEAAEEQEAIDVAADKVEGAPADPAPNEAAQVRDQSGISSSESSAHSVEERLSALNDAIKASTATKTAVAKHWRKGLDQIADDAALFDEVLDWLELS